MSTLPIPSFLDLTRHDWPPGRPEVAHAGAGDTGAPGAAEGSAPVATDGPAPADAGPSLHVRALPDGRLAFSLRSKVGATLLSGESSAPWADATAFGLRVLAACRRGARPRVVESADGPRLTMGDDADGFSAVSRPTTGPAHAMALQRLIAVQAEGASIRTDAG